MKSAMTPVAGGWLLAAAFTAFAGPAAAQVPAPGDRQVRTWAASCAACHNTEGRAIDAFAPLAGRDADDLYRALIDFRTGKRPATVMHHHTRGYTDDELRRIAEWFSKVKVNR